MKKNLFALMGVLCGIVSAVICVYSIQSGSSDIRLMYGAMAAFILCGIMFQCADNAERNEVRAQQKRTPRHRYVKTPNGYHAAA